VFNSVDDAYQQTVNWQDCAPQGLPARCATVYVPTDYDSPSAGTTGIAVAEFQTGFLGEGKHLLVNPGGPGAAGIDFAAQLVFVAFNLASAYDIVGFDPRGTGQSDPLVCLGTETLDELNAFDPTPETDAEREQGIELVDEQGQACEDNSGLLAAHVTTIEAARDMDVIRAVLGDEKMDYFGFSYGTFLGTTYASLFPDKVDRFVLDGAVAPGLNNMEASEVQTQGFQTAVTAYIKDCVKRTTCPLGTNPGDAQDKLRQLLEDVDADPLPTDDPARPLTQSLATYGMVLTMYDIGFWPQLSSALTAAFSDDGQPLLDLADQYFQRSGGEYQNNELQANQAINCLDEQVAGGPTQIPESKFVEDSPVFGDIFFGVADRGCGDWPPRTTLTPPDYSVEGTPPIVVVGTTRDPATPLVWAQELASTLDHGVLLTRDGDGHTAYLSGNQCIITHVDTFFLDGTVPPDGTTC
jgi:pimeloyl-ACP methyl ester carboxylesterase